MYSASRDASRTISCIQGFPQFTNLIYINVELCDVHIKFKISWGILGKIEKFDSLEFKLYFYKKRDNKKQHKLHVNNNYFIDLRERALYMLSYISYVFFIHIYFVHIFTSPRSTLVTALRVILVIARSALAHIHPCMRMRSSFRVSPSYLRQRWPPRKRTVEMLTLSFVPRSRHVLAQRKGKRACVRGSACVVWTVSCIEHRRGRRTDESAITRVKVVPVRPSSAVDSCYSCTVSRSVGAPDSGRQQIGQGSRE